MRKKMKEEKERENWRREVKKKNWSARSPSSVTSSAFLSTLFFLFLIDVATEFEEKVKEKERNKGGETCKTKIKVFGPNHH